MKFTHLLFLATALVSTTEARMGRWMNNGFNNNAQSIMLGNARIGFANSGMNADYIDLGRNPQINCNLTHIRLTSLGDSVLITRMDVEYMRPDRFGNSRDSIDLTMGQGQYLHLQGNQTSGWLDVDDVQDGFPNGRCIRSIQIYGVDTPDMGPGGPGGWRGGPGMGRGWGGRPGMGRPGFTPGQMRPAIVQIEGLIAQREFPGQGGHGGWHGNGQGGWNNGGGYGNNNPLPPPPPQNPYGPGYGPGYGHGGYNQPPMAPPVQAPWWRIMNRPERPLSFAPLGTTPLVKGPVRNDISVGIRAGRFDGLLLTAKDDNFVVESVIVTFGDMSQARFSGFALRENETRYIDFDWGRSGFRDNDRYIQNVTIIGGGPLFGTKARLEVQGGR